MGMNFKVYVGAYLRVKRPQSHPSFRIYDLFDDKFTDFRFNSGDKEFLYLTPNESQYELKRSVVFSRDTDEVVPISFAEIQQEISLFETHFKPEIDYLRIGLECEVNWGVLTAYD